MRAVMLSVRPKWCELIACGKKTIEVRKTRPTLETPFKCYIYETFGKWKWSSISIPEDQGGGELYDRVRKGGKVIGEFTCDKMYYIAYSIYPHDPLVFEEIGTLNRPTVRDKTCLTEIELDDYLNGNSGYGWHISDLQIYDRPKVLSEFTGRRQTRFGIESYCMKLPPQSWCYVEKALAGEEKK